MDPQKHHLDASEYADYRLGSAVKNHIETMIGDDTYYSSKATKNRYFLQCGKVLGTLFGNLQLSEINGETLLSLLNTMELTAGDLLILNRFVLYLVENKLINDETVKRFAIFKDRLCIRGTMKDIKRILTCDNFNRYLGDEFFTDKQKVKLFFIELPSEGFVDNQLYTALATQLEEIKFNTSSTAPSKINECYSFIKAAQKFFGDVYLKDINKLHIHDTIQGLDDSFTSSHLFQLTKILLNLLSEKLIYDNELYSFEKLKDHFLSVSLKNNFLRVFGSDIIEKFTVIGQKTTNRTLLYIGIDNPDIRRIWIEFSQLYGHRDLGFKTVCSEFDVSIRGLDISHIDSFNFKTFNTQIMYFGKYKHIDYIAPITAFYLYVYQNYNKNIFDQSNVDVKILQRQYTATELLDGYQVISYNPIESVPVADKWLLCYAGMEDRNSSVTTTATKAIDFTKIKSKTYREWYKHYIWHGNTGLHTKLHAISIIVLFLNYVYDIKQGKQFSIYSKKTVNEAISLNDVLAYKNHILNTKENNRTRNGYIYTARALLKHVLDNKLADVENGIFYHLSFTLSNDYNNSEPISDENLKKLAVYIKNDAESSIEKAVFYSIFYIALETEFRGSQILSLTTDCVHETSKPNEYVIKSKTKVSGDQIMEQPITIYVKRHIDEIIKMTDGFRRDCQNDDLKKYLFLLPSKKKGTFRILGSENFNKYLKKCCSDLGIKEYTLSNLRDTHMTKAEEFIIRNAMSDIEQSVLSGHKSPNTGTKHYIETQIKDLLESVHGVIIGNVNVEGKVLSEVPSEIATDENAVSNECGYCSSEVCNNFSYLDCLLCKDFITTLSRIPYFEEQIAVVNKKIKSVSIKHDKEDYVNIKLLLVNYLEELLILKGEQV